VIDPVNSSAAGSARAAASQTGATQQTAQDAVRSPAVRQDAGDGSTGDTIQLSATSLALQAQSGAASAPPSGTMSADQMQTVLGRVTSGYYDQPSARDAVAQGVMHDLTGDGASE
jgi:hypothetical protein